MLYVKTYKSSNDLLKYLRSYCVNHRPKQKIDDNVIQQTATLDNILCYICYDKVNFMDTLQTLWAPCCKKDAWFHRKCVQVSINDNLICLVL